MLFGSVYLTVDLPKEGKKIIEIKNECNNNYEPLQYKDFIRAVIENSDEILSEHISFRNNVDAEIQEEIFISYIQQYYNNPNFVLKVREKNNFSENQSLERTYSESECNSFVVGSNFETFFKKQKFGAEILSKEASILSDKERRTVIKYLASFTQGRFGFKPTKEEQLACAKACVRLFPNLTVDLLVNAENNGYLQVKLKNDRKRKKDVENEFLNTQHMEINTHQNQTLDASEILKAIDFINSANLPEELELVKNKLAATVEHRRNISKRSCKIFLDFHYYFICPELISYDFEISFKKSNFPEKWRQQYQKYIFTVVKESGKNFLYTECDRVNDWNCEILSILNLLRLLPPSPNGQKKQSRLSDEHAVSRLLIFKENNLTNDEYIKDSEGRAPHILAVGNTKSNIHQFFIVIDSNLIPITKNISFLECVDLVFKLHYLCNIEYDINLRIFWIFIQNYLYDIPCARVTPVVKELFAKFNKKREQN